MIGNIIKILKKILPDFLYNGIKIVYRWLKLLSKPFYNIYFNIKLKKVQANHKKALEIVRKKEKIKVAFFMLNTDTWKYDSVYKHFVRTERFVPVVVVCPFINKGYEFLKSELEKSVNYCIKMNYNYILGYNIEKQKSIDIKNSVKPDIVFFSNPNKLTTQEFLINNYLDTLTCYVTYSFRISKHFKYEHNAYLLNVVWLNFCETPIHKNLAIKYAINKGKNTVVTGHPHLDNFKQSSLKNVWKPQLKRKKRIIWAPHWTIKGYQSTGHDWSCFLDYAEIFLKLANEFKNEIQLAIKPHPFLKTILQRDDLWGPLKTEEYFLKWQHLDNCQLVEGDYVDLFTGSDALIHDSGGFMIEYLTQNKPLAYTLNNRNINESLNEVGQSAIKVHCILKNENDLRMFILDVKNNIDKNLRERSKFVENFLSIGGNTASQNIINEILNRII